MFLGCHTRNQSSKSIKPNTVVFTSGPTAAAHRDWILSPGFLWQPAGRIWWRMGIITWSEPSLAHTDSVRLLLWSLFIRWSPWNLQCTLSLSSFSFHPPLCSSAFVCVLSVVTLSEVRDTARVNSGDNDGTSPNDEIMRPFFITLERTMTHDYWFHTSELCTAESLSVVCLLLVVINAELCILEIRFFETFHTPPRTNSLEVCGQTKPCTATQVWSWENGSAF